MLMAFVVFLSCVSVAEAAKKERAKKLKLEAKKLKNQKKMQVRLQLCAVRSSVRRVEICLPPSLHKPPTHPPNAALVFPGLWCAVCRSGARRKLDESGKQSRQKKQLAKSTLNRIWRNKSSISLGRKQPRNDSRHSRRARTQKKRLSVSAKAR